MIFHHRRHRQAADQAEARLLENREALMSQLAEQEARWRQRTSWLLPLAFAAGFLLKRARPGRKLFRLARGLVLVGDWINHRGIYRRTP
jgi:hypothetical protein